MFLNEVSFEYILEESRTQGHLIFVIRTLHTYQYLITVKVHTHRSRM